MADLQIHDFSIGTGHPLVLIAGPCVIEGEQATLDAARRLQEIAKRHGVPLIFKSSYDKANRTSVKAYRGPGLERGLEILAFVKEELDLPVITDIHSPIEALAVAETCDLLQIPAFLCRQTDLLIAAGKTGCAVAIKKGQFMAPWDMGGACEKVRSTGNEKLLLMDRGTCFGYNNLISDMRAIPIMQKVGDCPVCFDATHSVQLPGGGGHYTAGQREYAAILARAAVAAGADVLFVEAHADPSTAKSDAATMLNFEEVDDLLSLVKPMRELLREHSCSNALL